MRIFLFACLFAVLAGPAARAQTELSLSATGTAIATSDEIVASLTVQETAAKAPQAQAAVNAAMKSALAAAHALAGVTATTGAYNVFETSPQTAAEKSSFQASQTLGLTMPAQGGLPPPSFSALVGKLQQDGLLLGELDGQLSAEGQDKASAAATADAIQRLQSQAASIASSLGERVTKLKKLDVETPGPIPVMAPRMELDAAIATPPQAAPGPVTVQVSVNGVIELSPRTP